MSTRPSNAVMVGRAMLRRCPNCGSRGIFAGYTELRTSCPRCGMRLQRGESDYFIGAYLLNLVAVELLFAALLGVVILMTYPNTPWVALQWGGLVVMGAGAVLCYPFAKSMWLAADLIFRPMTDEELAWHRANGEADRELPQL